MKRRIGMLVLALLLLPTVAFAEEHDHDHSAPIKPIITTGEKGELQQLIDAAAPGETLRLEGKTYRGAVTITKPLTLQGVDGTKFASLTTGLTIVDTEQVVIENIAFEIEDVSIMADNVTALTLRNLDIEQGVAGIQLTNVRGIMLDDVDVTGPSGHFSTKGHAVAIYEAEQLEAMNNDITSVQDGFYLEGVKGVTLRNNTINNARYAVHMMYSDDVLLTDNTVSRNMTGFMVMVGKRITVTNNVIEKNNTLNSLGVYMYDNEDVTFTRNTVRENTTALSIDNTLAMNATQNEFASNGTAFQVRRSGTLSITDNTFYGNILTLRTDKEGVQLHRNVYDDYTGKDYDGDGIGDTSYMATNAFGQWMVRKPVYQYFIESPSVVTLNLMETAVTDAQSNVVFDTAPLVQQRVANFAFDVHAGQLVGSALILLTLIGIRRKLA